MNEQIHTSTKHADGNRHHCFELFAVPVSSGQSSQRHQVHWIIHGFYICCCINMLHGRRNGTTMGRQPNRNAYNLQLDNLCHQQWTIDSCVLRFVFKCFVMQHHLFEQLLVSARAKMESILCFE